MKIIGWWRRRRRDIFCQQWVELVTDYLEGTLSTELRQAADGHLAECPHCREYLEQMRRTIAVSGHLRHEEVPEDVVDALTKAFAELRRGR